MRSDDLAPVLAQPPAAAVGFRQGTILSWNSGSQENVVEVGGGQFTNLSVLGSPSLQAGQVVGILTTGAGAQSWFIVGRITIPAP